MMAHRLRHRILIETPQRVQNTETGDVATVWATLYENVPAEVLTGPGRDAIAAGALQNEATCRINIRWFDISRTELVNCRITWDGRLYSIVSAEQDITARREWRLTCQEGVEVYG
jgi:SPP1 family predicted phage head-tail adaptor